MQFLVPGFCLEEKSEKWSQKRWKEESVRRRRERVMDHSERTSYEQQCAGERRKSRVNQNCSSFFSALWCDSALLLDSLSFLLKRLPFAGVPLREAANNNNKKTCFPNNGEQTCAVRVEERRKKRQREKKKEWPEDDFLSALLRVV